MSLHGFDTKGNAFRSPAELWRSERRKGGWYEKGVAYWEGVAATVDGVLGGFGHVSGSDVRESKEFAGRADVMGQLLQEARGGGARRLAVLDCGAGVGRVTKECLVDLFHEVDLCEPVDKFVEQSKENLCGVRGEFGGTARNYFCVGLERFTPAEAAYDVIWCQWVLPHINDTDLIAFFHRCARGLRPGGFFMVKENIAQAHFVMDVDDSSITRTDDYFRSIFKRAGLEVFASQRQREFPQELFGVMMYACRFPGGVVPKRGVEGVGSGQQIAQAAALQAAAPATAPPKRKGPRPAMID